MRARTPLRRWLLALSIVAATVVGLVRAEPTLKPGAAPIGSAALPSGSAPVERHGRSEPITSFAIYPLQSVALKFDHARHVRGLRLPCTYCHSEAVTSRDAKDRLLPPASRCDACHGTDHDNLEAVRSGSRSSGQCAFCHVGYSSEEPSRVARTVIPKPNLRFDHAVHADRGIPCTECHAGIEREGLATRSALPEMRTCTRCHAPDAPKEVRGKDGCDVCHLTVTGSRLRTQFPSGELTPPAWMHGALHGPDWIERHKVAAGTDSAFCSSCHAEKECVDCHDGRVRPRAIHPNDWLSLHPMVARQNGPSCTSCHREQSFCITCHTRVGLTMSSPDAVAGERGRFHPPKDVWTDAPRTARHHSWEAQRNLTACVSCHTERDCAGCHATSARGGTGGLNPHPPGFAAGCRTAFSKNPRPCLFCHDPSLGGNGSLAQCR